MNLRPDLYVESNCKHFRLDIHSIYEKREKSTSPEGIKKKLFFSGQEDRRFKSNSKIKNKNKGKKVRFNFCKVVEPRVT